MKPFTSLSLLVLVTDCVLPSLVFVLAAVAAFYSCFSLYPCILRLIRPLSHSLLYVFISFIHFRFLSTFSPHDSVLFTMYLISFVPLTIRRVRCRRWLSTIARSRAYYLLQCYLQIFPCIRPSIFFLLSIVRPVVMSCLTLSLYEKVLY